MLYYCICLLRRCLFRGLNMGQGETFGLAFSNEEYLRRVNATQEIMSARNIDILLLFSPMNTCYLSGFNTVGLLNYQCLILPVEGSPILIVRALEKRVAQSTTGLDQIHGFEDHEPPETVIKGALKQIGGLEKHIAADQTNGGLGFQAYQRLQKELGVEFSDGSGIVETVSIIKSETELDYIRRAARISETGMQAGYAAISEGRSENDVAAESYYAMVKAGSEFFNLQPVVTAGEKTGIAHSNFHRGVLKQGDSVMLELGAVWNRYAGPLFRTAAVGTVTGELRKMYDACANSLEATLEAIKPGALSQDVQKAAQDVINFYGYEKNFRKRVGYCFGVGFPPDWGQGYIMDLKHHDERQLKTGMVFHIAPALRELGRFGVACSETVAVTESGVEVITNFPRELFISR
jgi:Xaa-Pro dipeptidase